MRARNTAIFLVPGLIWGSEWITNRFIDLPSLAALAVRCGVAAALLAAVAVSRRLRLPSSRQFLIAAISGVTLIAAPAMLTIWAAGRISPGLLTVLLAMTPLITALLEGRAAGTLLVPLVGGVAGAALLASQGLSFALTQAPGVIALLLAVALFAGSIVSIKREPEEVDPVIFSATQLTTAALCCALVSFPIEGRAAYSGAAGWMIAPVVLVAAGSALAYPLYYWLLKRMNSFQLTSLQWVVTVAGVIEALIFVREMPTWRISAGVVVMLVSLVMLLKTTSEGEAPLTIQSTTLPS